MLSEDAQNKLEQIRNLQREIAQKEEELEDLLGFSYPVAGETKSKRGRPKGRVCGVCGKAGHNAKTCSKGKKRNPMSEGEFIDVKIAQEDGVSSKDCAEDSGLSLQEVNRAYQSSDYESYKSK